MDESAADNTYKVIVVDDDPHLLRLISIRLESAGYKVKSCDSAKQALGMLDSYEPDLVITDLCMEGMDGMALFTAIQEQYSGLPVIILTAHGTIPDAVNATKQGVFSYLTKPFNSQELLKSAADAVRLHASSSATTNQTEETSWKTNIISRNQVMNDLLQQVEHIASSDVSVLIQSESGTGKELLAKAIHEASDRKGGEFIAVNCAAIPENLLESELFGHVKGAFSGADRNHDGLFKAANGGTLFLDEIGDMPLNFQVKLLRTIQEQEVRPVGSTKAIKVDVRIISATHRDLEKSITEGLFREDLYYRLNVVELALPKLADRREDIPLLINHFLKSAKKKTSVAITGYSDSALELLISAPWPGNIRQLMNVVERTVALSTKTIITDDLVQKALRDKSTGIESFSQARDSFERQYLSKLLKLTTGNVSQAAKLAQRNRTEFYKLLEKHHLKAEAYRE